MTRILLILPLTLLAFSCESKRSSESVNIASYETAPAADMKQNSSRAGSGSLSLGVTGETNSEAMPPQDPSSGPRVEKTEKKIIRNATARFEVKDLQKSTKAVESKVKALGGYISSSSQQNHRYNLQTLFTIRIHSEKLDTLLHALEQEAIYIAEKTISSQDVTTQFIDTEARLKSKREVEKRYLELLKEANKVNEVIEVENQLRVIREEIEAKEGILKYLSDQVNYSTINLTIYEQVEGMREPQKGFFKKIAKGIADGWFLLLDFIVGVFHIWPFILLAVVLIWLFRRWRRRRNQNQ